MCENVYPTIAVKQLPERHGRRAEGGRLRRGGMVLRGRVVSAPAIIGKTRARGLRVVRQTTVGGNHANSTIVRKARIKHSNGHSLGGTEETTKDLPGELALSLPHRPAFHLLSPTSIAPLTPPPPPSPPAPSPSRWTFRRGSESRFSGPRVYTPLTLNPPSAGLGSINYIGVPSRRDEGDIRWERSKHRVYLPPSPSAQID